MDKVAINQSLIKAFFYKGEKRDYCPYSIYMQYITKEVNVQTEAMMKGSFFETLCLGSGIDNNVIDDLPRKKLTSKQIIAGQKIGDKKIDQIRIEQQHLNFERSKAIYQINVQKNVNTQVEIVKYFSKNDNIIIKGNLDIFPTTILLPQRGLRLAVIDLKLTGKFSDFGEYCWATPANMDMTQGYMYHELIRDIDIELNMEINPNSRLLYLFTGAIKKQLETIEPLFFFWIFDYKSSELNNKFVEVSYNATTKAELFESIRKTVYELNKNERNGWHNLNPNAYSCNGCPIIQCQSRHIDNTNNQFNNFEQV
jgi:hypothetical protein